MCKMKVIGHLQVLVTLNTDTILPSRTCVFRAFLHVPFYQLGQHLGVRISW